MVFFAGYLLQINSILFALFLLDLQLHALNLLDQPDLYPLLHLVFLLGIVVNEIEGIIEFLPFLLAVVAYLN